MTKKNGYTGKDIVKRVHQIIEKSPMKDNQFFGDAFDQFFDGDFFNEKPPTLGNWGDQNRTFKTTISTNAVDSNWDDLLNREKAQRAVAATENAEMRKKIAAQAQEIERLEAANAKLSVTVEHLKEQLKAPLWEIKKRVFAFKLD